MEYDEQSKEKPAGVDEVKLQAIVSQQIELAKSHDSREREGSRSKALDYYLANMDKYVPPETGRSKVTSHDTADTIGWMLPGVMRVFTASDNMAVAKPVGIEDERFAGEATSALNYIFWKENKGYETVYSASWDALLQGNGIVKTYFDDTPVYKTSFHSGLTEDQLAQLLMTDDGEDEGPEVLQKTEDRITITDETGVPQEIVVYDVKIRRKVEKGRFVVEAIAPEKFLIDADAIFTDEAAFTAHWEQKTRSELVAMGYDKDEVAVIPQSAADQTSEEASRRVLEPHDYSDSSMELVDYYECFIRIDVDDDGEAELVRACFAGSQNGKLLDWEVWEDEHPFDDIPCEPIPHRWTARSIFDETHDVQDVKTVLIRQALNNVYWANNPQRFVKGDIKNPDELVNPSFGGVIMGQPNAEISNLEAPFVADMAFQAITYQDEVIQRRTGIGRGTMALDPEALQNQTATASQNAKDAGYSQIELVARNMAEWGWRKVFRKLLRLIIKHQDGPRVLMVKNKPVRIDPRHWNADMDITINVGLGTGSRDRDMAMLNQILLSQVGMADRFTQAGLMDEALEMLEKITHTQVRLTEAAGIRNPEEYFPEFNQERLNRIRQQIAQRSAQPDPKVQADLQKMQADVQQRQAEMQFKARQQEQEFALKREKIAGEMQLKREQLAAELELKREQMAAEMQLKREMGFVDGFAKTNAAIQSNVRMGGEPG